MDNKTHGLLLGANGAYIALCIAAAGDLLVPYLLAPQYKGYRHLTMVMSLLGGKGSPVQPLYNLWLLTAGLLYLWGGAKLYTQYASVSKGLAGCLSAAVWAFALGACLLSGLCSVGETKGMATLPEKIHGIGSALGFLAYAFVPLLLALLCYRAREPAMGFLSAFSFVGAFAFFTLFIMADKASFAGTPIAYEGLWQRLSLAMMSAPVCIVSIRQILAAR